jgi:hypothetical protein
MSNLLVHPFASAKSDTADATLVQPSNWNDGHKFTGGAHGNVMMRDTSDTTYGASWIANANNALLSTNASGVPSWVTTIPSGVQDNITRLGAIVTVLSATGFGTHTFSAGGAGNNEIAIRNTTAGTGNAGLLTIGNNADANLVNMWAFSSTYTSSGPYQANGFTIQAAGAGGLSLVASHASGPLRFYSGGTTETGRLDLTGSLQIGGTAVRAGTAGTKRLDIFDGTAPTSTLANGISLYSTAGELRVMDAAGNATLLSPHDHDTNEWIYLSVNTVTRRRLRIDMERLMRALDAQMGGGFIREEAA